MIARSARFFVLLIALGAAVSQGQHLYTMEHEGVDVALFPQCGQISSENQVITELFGPVEIMVKTPGGLSFGDVVCVRGVSSDLSLWAWRGLVETGRMAQARRDLSLRVTDSTGSLIARFLLEDSWPAAIRLDQQQREVLVLAVGRMERLRLSLSQITWDPPADIVYGEALGDRQLNAHANMEGTFTYTPRAGTNLNAGTHTLSVSFVPEDPNFGPASASVSLNVLKAPLEVIAENKTSMFRDPFPPLTARYSGFVLGDTSADLSGAPELATPANFRTSPPGVYPITVSAGTLGAANYGFQFVPGTLTILVRRGDANGDGSVSVADLLHLVAMLFGLGPGVEATCQADVDGNGVVNISDIFYLVNHLFAGGPPPVAC